MPPHRDWTRHGVGRALLWWPFVAFVLVAAFPALAVPCVVASGLCLGLVGLVGGAIFRRRRARRVREARAPRALEAVPTITIEAVPTITKANGASRAGGRDAIPAATPQSSDDDAEDDHPVGTRRRAA